jgi:hypothetical protein
VLQRFIALVSSVNQHLINGLGIGDPRRVKELVTTSVAGENHQTAAIDRDRNSRQFHCPNDKRPGVSRAFRETILG